MNNRSFTFIGHRCSYPLLKTNLWTQRYHYTTIQSNGNLLIHNQSTLGSQLCDHDHLSVTRLKMRIRLLTPTAHFFYPRLPLLKQCSRYYSSHYKTGSKDSTSNTTLVSANVSLPQKLIPSKAATRKPQTMPKPTPKATTKTSKASNASNTSTPRTPIPISKESTSASEPPFLTEKPSKSSSPFRHKITTKSLKANRSKMAAKSLPNIPKGSTLARTSKSATKATTKPSAKITKAVVRGSLTEEQIVAIIEKKLVAGKLDDTSRTTFWNTLDSKSTGSSEYSVTTTKGASNEVRNIKGKIEKVLSKSAKCSKKDHTTDVKLILELASKSTKASSTALGKQGSRKKSAATSTTTTTSRKKLVTKIEKPIITAKVSAFDNYINTLPPMKVPDKYKIVCTNSKREADEILKTMTSKGTIFGVDMEWRPAFKKGVPEHSTGLIQICGDSSILLIQQSQMKGLPDELVKFLKNENILKTGVSIRDDGLKLHRDFGIKANGLLDLAPLARLAFTMAPKLHNYNRYSLKALTGSFLQSRLEKSKKVQLSNWNAQRLSEKQIKYASADAYASYALYQPLMDISKLEKSKLTLHHLSIQENL